MVSPHDRRAAVRGRRDRALGCSSPRESREAPAAVLAGFGLAQPGPPVAQSDLWDGFFASHFEHSAGARRIFLNTGVTSRYAAADPLREDVSHWGTQRRMRRYAAEAPPLGRAAVTQALDAAELDPADVGMFAVASCTGYTTPGVDITLATELGMSPDVQRLGIGHMGCYAALPGIGAVSDYVRARARPAVLLCVELPSLHVQPPSRDLEQVVAHGLFSDAAAAVAVRPGGAAPPGLTLLDLVAVTDPATSDHMSWQVTDHGFRMGLSPRVADVLARHVPGLVGTLLARHGLSLSEIAAWAVHPGGPRILDVVESELSLPPGALKISRGTLRDHGNCSSATILLVVRDMVRRGMVPPGGHLVAMAFGPGLTLYAALLRG